MQRRSLPCLKRSRALIGAGLLTQSLRNLENQQFGFVTQGRLIVSVNPADFAKKAVGRNSRLNPALPESEVGRGWSNSTDARIPPVSGRTAT
jgi:hypothetical protein